MMGETYYFRVHAACYGDCVPGDVLQVMPPLGVVYRVRDDAELPANYGRLARGIASGEIVPVRHGEAAPVFPAMH